MDAEALFLPYPFPRMKLWLIFAKDFFQCTKEDLEVPLRHSETFVCKSS